MSRRFEKRRLGLGTASSIVVGNMVGAGVFTTSGFALADLGSASLVLLAWAVAGGVALCGALAYGGLAVRVPRSGGEYTFLSETLHPAAGFLDAARARGATTWVNSLDEPANLHPADRFLPGRASEVVPAQVERWLASKITTSNSL